MGSRSFNYLGGDYYISAASLLLEYRMFIDSHPTLFRVNAANPCWPKLVFYCEELEKSPDIMRFITRIHVDSQLNFERALFCSWCSLLVAGSLRLSEMHQRTVFCAGLLQDIGQYAEDKELQNTIMANNRPSGAPKNDIFDKDIHPLVSAKIAEKNLPELVNITDLILHHHAKDDGTGYPSHISESQLGIDNQILIVANELSDRLDALGGHNNFEFVLPNLRLNSFLYFEKVHLSWIKLLEPHINKTVLEIDKKVLQKCVEVKIYQLEKMLSCLLVVSSELLYYDFDLKVHALRSLIRRLASLSTDTGIFDPILFANKINNAPAKACTIVHDIDVMLKGLPETLMRLAHLVDDILNVKTYDINITLLQDAAELLHRNIKALEGKHCSIFR